MPDFAFMRVQRIPALDDSLYLWRLRILETPWFGIYLHRIFRSDSDRELHDHPWPFVSFVLRGYYLEEVPLRRQPFAFGGVRRATANEIRRVQWFNFKRATDFHRISFLSRRQVWTLVVRGLRARGWRFQTDDGYLDHDEWIARRTAPRSAT